MSYKNFMSEFNPQLELLISWQDTIQEEDSEESAEKPDSSVDEEFEKLKKKSIIASVEQKTADSSNRKMKKPRILRKKVKRQQSLNQSSSEPAIGTNIVSELSKKVQSRTRMPKKKTKVDNHSADFSVINLLATKKQKPTHRRLFSDPSKPKIISEMTYSPLVLVETGSCTKKIETSEYSFKKGKNTKTTTNSVVSESRTSGHSSAA